MTDESQKNTQDEIDALLAQVRNSDSTSHVSDEGEPANPGESSQSQETPVASSTSPNPDVAAAGASTSVGTPSAGQPTSPEAKNSANVGNDIDYLLKQTQEALGSVDAPSNPAIDGLKDFTLQEFAGSPPSTDFATLDLLRDVELDLKIELGRTEMYLDEVLRLKRGSVVPLDKLAGDPVDVYVNGRLVARGEVLVLNDNFCVRVAELITGNELD